MKSARVPINTVPNATGKMKAYCNVGKNDQIILSEIINKFHMTVHLVN